MKRKIRILFAQCAVLLCAASAWADVVHVTYQTSTGGTVSTVAEAALETGCAYTTIPAPTKNGYIFTHWTISTKQDFAARDAWGRAYDAPSFMLYEDTTLTAHYVSATQDTDGDGVPDGHELYWYGDLAPDAASDTDGDGATFAEELANGTNPHFPDTSESGGVSRALSGTFLYNPHRYAPVVVRSEPEGRLCTTTTNYCSTGDLQRTPTLSVADGFAYWTVDGVEQRDAFGRALDQAVVTPDSGRVLDVVAHYVADEAARLSYYWYGRPDVAMDSDTDGDGFTFAEEIANGTNPHFPDTTEPGGIAYADSDTLEANLQPFDPATGAVVGEAFEELFTSPFAGNGATSRTFGPNARPVVADVNGDGLFDLVILYDGGYAVYLNGGTSGNPTFMRDDTVATNGLDLAQGSLAALDGLTLDVPPTDAVSCAFGDVDRDGIADLLVSDAEGRIWFYRGLGENAFALQHKVWGGSHAGFAPRLTIALVDWDGDGDLDCVCGTADGKLMLLVDPRVGRPTNVQATAGVDSVVLTWDPNGNSRVRGYGVYRGADTNAYDRIEAQWPLPRYRDVPEVVQDYYYRVTSVSRFYTSGNSMPTTSESLPTDAVYVQFRPHVWLTGTSGFTGSNVTVIVSMNNSMGISAEGLSLTFAYDSAVLAPRGIRTTGLTAGLAGGGTASVPSAGTWRFASQGGEIATGAGRFLLLDFTIRPVHDVTETTVTLTAATVKALDGRAVTLDLPQSATVEISDSDPLVPAIVAVHVADAAVDSETTFDLPVTVTATEALTNFAATVAWDETLLELKGIQTGLTGLTGLGENLVNPVNPVKNSYAFQTSGGDFALTFYAKDPASAATNFAARVSLTGVAANDCHGFAVSAADAAGTVLIKNAHPWVPATVSVGVGSVSVETRTTFEMPVTLTSSERLTNFTATVEWDADVLELKGVQTGLDGNPVNPVKNSYALQTSGSDFALTFYVKDQHAVTRTAVRLTGLSAVDAHGLAAHAIADAAGTVLIRDAHPLVPAGVALNVSTVYADTLSAFTVPIPVTSTKVLTNLSFMVGWDANVLELRGASGGAFLDGVPSADTAKVGAKGTVPGTLYLTFYAKDQHTAKETAITLKNASARCIDGLAARITTVDGTVQLTDANAPVPVELTVAAHHVRTRSGEPFKVPVGATTSGDLATLTVDVEWDASLLTFGGCPAAQRVTTLADNRRRFVFACAGNYNLFSLDFTAARIAGLQTNSWTRVVAASGVGKNGLAAIVKTALPCTGNVIIAREIGKYDPGDLDGDGAYTDADVLILNGYLVYLKMQKKGASFAAAYAEAYRRQYGVDVRLTGAAARAADVNGDGEVSSSDVAMLKMLVSESEGAGK